jgi:3' terminal RNA ribose 2'-O-methyltransferase Hen1
MLLTITNLQPPATDLGHLLHKNPARVQSFALAFGQAHVFYPEALAERCTAALLLDIDPVGLVRGPSGTLDQYVNDRPYVASSFMSVAIAQVFGSALAGRSTSYAALAATPLPLEAQIAALPCRDGEPLLRRLFEPLGYQVLTQGAPLDEQFPDWGHSRYYTLTLRHQIRLADLLTHLYVLLPVLYNEKHYWVGDEEVAKLLRHGTGWLAEHPEKQLIANRYLKYRRSLARDALSRLVAEEQPDLDQIDDSDPADATTHEPPISLHEQRLNAVLAVLKASNASRVLDLGCGEGKLLRSLLADPQFTQIVGMDVAHRSLEIAEERLHLDRLPASQKQRIKLIQGSLLYRDQRLAGFDAAALVEVIEHLDPDRLASFERVVFEFARPTMVVITTPNSEYNIRFEKLTAGTLRHSDHRFEWTRAEFQAWAHQIAERFGYTVRFLPVGTDDLEVGPPSQMGIFTRHVAE